VPVRFVTRDDSYRVPGDVCTASRPYMYIHNGSTITLAAVDGSFTHEQVLPLGYAERSDDSETPWGEDQFLTNCVFIIEGAGLVDGTKYSLSINGKQLVESFTYNASLIVEGTPAFPFPALVEGEDSGQPDGMITDAGPAGDGTPTPTPTEE
jgi:hypothetical protein